MFSSSARNIEPGTTNDNFELAKAWIGTSIAFAIAMVGGQFNSEFPTFFLAAALTCGIGFVFHELAHRIVARSYQARAHFVADNMWLIISIVLAFTGFFIAAPGAVWHWGYLTKQQSGLIALAGPVTNFVLAALFLVILWLIPLDPFLTLVCFLGYRINAWLGLFNMIPFGPFDGAKVIDWDKVVFGVTVAVGVLMVFVIPGTPLMP